MKKFTFGGWVYARFEIEAENFEEATKKYNTMIHCSEMDNCETIRNAYFGEMEDSQYAWENFETENEIEYDHCGGGWYANGKIVVKEEREW